MKILLLVAAMAAPCAAAPLAPRERDALLDGPHAVVDPGFGYYRDRSLRGVVKEIRATGVSTVSAYLRSAEPDLVAACHDEGLAFCGILWGTIIYGSRSLTPPPPLGALQVHLSGPRRQDHEPAFYCPRHPEFREWYRAYAGETLRAVEPDAVVITENFFGAWPGPSSPMTGCFCDLCLAELARRLGRTQPIVLAGPDERRALLEDPKAFREWVDMRVAVWADFMKEALDGVRESLPGAPVGAVLLAVDDPDGPRRIREANGQDALQLLERARFDFISFQAHWPDWMTPGLVPERHAESYRPYVEAVRSRSPSVRVGLIPDIGSAENCRRGSAWVRRLQVAARRAGFTFVEPYEYSVGGAVYENPPQVIECRRLSKNECELVFSKRLDPASVRRPGNFRLETGRQPASLRFDGGNIVTLRFDDDLPDGPRTLEIENVRDDPANFWFNRGKDRADWKYHAHSVPEGTRVTW